MYPTDVPSHFFAFGDHGAHNVARLITEVQLLPGFRAASRKSIFVVVLHPPRPMPRRGYEQGFVCGVQEHLCTRFPHAGRIDPVRLGIVLLATIPRRPAAGTDLDIEAGDHQLPPQRPAGAIDGSSIPQRGFRFALDSL